MIRCLLVLVLVFSAQAQDDAPRQMVRARLEPAGDVVLGQPVHLHVEVLVTTWLTGGVNLPPLDMPGAVVTIPQERAQNLNVTIEGQNWFGISRSYLIYPQEPREYVTPAAEIVVRFGGGSGEPARLLLPQLSFSAVIPPEAAGLGYFISTNRFRLTQQLDPAGDSFKTGDSIKRTVAMEAAGTLAMFLPPVELTAPDGLAVYPDPPSMADEQSERAGFRGGRRTDSASYVIKQPGDYHLPEISVSWWNLDANRIETATAPAVDFHAVLNPDAVSELPPELAPPDDGIPPEPANGWRQWLAAGFAGLLALSAIVWLARRVRRVIQRHRRDPNVIRSREEALRFRRLLRHAAGGDADATLRSLLGWLDVFDGAGGAVTASEFARRSGRRELRIQVEGLQRAAYSSAAPPAVTWAGAQFAAELVKARKECGASGDATAAGVALPPLNP